MIGKNFQRFVFGTDLHGSLQDPATVKAFLRFCDDFKPHIRTFGGDAFDYRALLKKANKEDRASSLVEDHEAGEAFISTYRPRVLLWGNHDWRMFRMVNSVDAVESALASKIVHQISELCRKLKVLTVPWGKREGVYPLGDLNLSHGYFSGAGAARRMAASYGNCMFGHNHTSQVEPFERHSVVYGRGIGALCQLDFDYNLPHVGSLRHSHGWGYGIMNTRTGKTHSWQAEEIDGQWILPTGFKTL